MAINTFGWDLVYAVKFNEVNAVLQQNKDAEQKAKDELKTAILNAVAETNYNKTSTSLAGILETASYIYSATPVLSIQSIDQGEVGCTLTPLMAIKQIRINTQGTGYTTAPVINTVGGNPTTPAVFTTDIVVSSVTITNPGNGDYFTSPVTITGPNGFSATAITDGGGLVTTPVTITNAGTGYDMSNPPMLTVTGDGSGATAIANLALVVKLVSGGSGYRSVPALNFGPGITGVQYDVFMGIEDIEGVNAFTSDFQTPSLLISRGETDACQQYDATTRQWSAVDARLADKAFTTFTYTQPAKIYNTGDDAKTFFLRLFKAVAWQWLQKMAPNCRLKQGTQFNQADLDILLDTATLGDTDKVADKIFAVSTDSAGNTTLVNNCLVNLVLDYFFSKISVYKLQPTLQVLQKLVLYQPDYYAVDTVLTQIASLKSANKDDKIKESVQDNSLYSQVKDEASKTVLKNAYDYINYLAEAPYIFTYYAGVFPQFNSSAGTPIDRAKSLIAILISEEKKMAGQRVFGALRNIDASIVFNYNAVSGVASQDKTFNQISVATNRDKSILIYNVTSAVLALWPEQYSDAIIGVGQIVKSIPYQFQKIRLYTEAWQLATGGDSSNLRMKIPVIGGVAYFGDDIILIEPRHQCAIYLKIKLAWLKSSKQADLQIKQSSIEVEGFTQEQGAPDYTDDPLLKNILQAFVQNTLNKARYTPTATSGNTVNTYSLLNPVDAAYSYNHTFASLDIYEKIAETESEFAWMYPTTASYAVKDAFEDEPDINNSVFAVCCMSEGRQNKNAPEVDITAIPPGATSSVLISKEILLRKFVLPYFVLLFTDSDGKTATGDCFTMASNQSFYNSKPLQTYALGLVNGDKEKTSLIGNADIGSVFITVTESNITVNFTNIKHTYKSEYNPNLFNRSGNLTETTVKVSRTYQLNFKLENGAMNVAPVRLTDNYAFDYAGEDPVSWGELAGSFMFYFLTTAATMLVMPLGAKMVSKGIKLVQNYRNRKSIARTIHPQSGPQELNYELQRLNLANESIANMSMEVQAPELSPVHLRTELEKIQLKSNVGQVNREIKFEGIEIKNNERTITLESTLKLTNDLDTESKEVKVDIFYDKQSEAVKIEKVPEAIIWAADDLLLKVSEIIKTLIRPQERPIIPEPMMQNWMSSGSQRIENIEDAQHGVQNESRRWARLCWDSINNSEFGKWLFKMETISGLIGNGIAGGLIWWYYADKDSRYQAYKNNVEGKVNTDNTVINGIKYLTENLASKIHWPSFKDDQGLDLKAFYLDGNLVIGLARQTTGRLLEGHVSAYNPHVPMLSMPANVQSITIQNKGNNPLKFSFLRNLHAYQGLLERKIGKTLQVKEHSTQTIALTHFEVADFEHTLLYAEAVENDTHYTITIN